MKFCQLFYGLLVMMLLTIPRMAYAHPSPNSLLLLDVNASQVDMEVQLPVPELELAFGDSTLGDPATLIERMEVKLQSYLESHIHVYSSASNPWKVDVREMKMDKGTYVGTNSVYWELIIHVFLTPPSDESTRAFVLSYDAITDRKSVV